MQHHRPCSCFLLLLTQLASTGLASALSSSWGILPLVAGITFFKERPAVYQLFGVLLVLAGLFLLSIKPS